MSFFSESVRAAVKQLKLLGAARTKRAAKEG